MAYSLEQLQIFAAIDKAGSFSGAARLLGRTQSSVSTAIANLEADWNVALFDRSSKVPVMTESGRRLLREANDAARSLGRGSVGNNVMYFETGQGSAALVWIGDTAYRLTNMPPEQGIPKVVWSDGEPSLTWTPGVQLMWMASNTHLMCGRDGGHQH